VIKEELNPKRATRNTKPAKGEPKLLNAEQPLTSNYETAKGFCITSAFWMMIGTIAGLTTAIQFIAPDLLGNNSWLTFGRIRPVHTNIVIFGFVTSGLIAISHFILPRLLRTELYSEKLGMLTVLLWNLILVAMVITLVLGHTQGREYAEAIWSIDVLVGVAFILMFFNLAMTIRQRKEPLLYVSVWYIIVSILLTVFVYSIGNVIWFPGSGALTGIPDAVVNWFYGRNLLGVLVTTLAVAVAYYVIPSACRTPLYSHSLSLVGFWTILVMYTHIGTHHLLQVPAPTWLKVIAIVGSVGMIIPVTVVLVNLWFTVKGKLGVIHENIGAKFVFTGTVIYLLTCIQGPVQSLPQVQRLTHYSNWVVAHAHMGVLGFSGMTALGGIYYILPKITGKPLFSKSLADFQYWLILIGLSGFMVSLTVAGLIQGNGWLNGEIVYRILPQIHVYNVVRASMGLMIVISAIVGLYNIARSIFFNPGERA
jgi:cytochrome c oxidase cbb3-type subunit 1/cytochrome c oxidase cbb3-type subunit I/II